jgi:hypothetical protein
MIIKRQKIDNLIIHRCCFLANEKLFVNGVHTNDEMLWWGYNVYGKINVNDLPTSSFELECKKLKSFKGSNVELRAGPYGAVFIGFMKHIDDLTDDYVCQLVTEESTITFDEHINEAILVPLSPKLLLTEVTQKDTKDLLGKNVVKLNTKNIYTISLDNDSCKALLFYR